MFIDSGSVRISRVVPSINPKEQERQMAEAEEKIKEHLTLAQRAINTLTWMIQQFDCQNAMDAQETDEAMGEHLMPNDSPRMKEARLVLADLISAHGMLNEAIMQLLQDKAFPQYTIAPTDCHECMKEETPVCPYWNGGCKRPNPNPCPQHEPIPLANCPCCKGHIDVSDMRHKEYKCRIRNIDLTKAMPKTCRYRQER